MDNKKKRVSFRNDVEDKDSKSEKKQKTDSNNNNNNNDNNDNDVDDDAFDEEIFSVLGVKKPTKVNEAEKREAQFVEEQDELKAKAT